MSEQRTLGIEDSFLNAPAHAAAVVDAKGPVEVPSVAASALPSNGQLQTSLTAQSAVPPSVPTSLATPWAREKIDEAIFNGNFPKPDMSMRKVVTDLLQNCPKKVLTAKQIYKSIREKFIQKFPVWIKKGTWKNTTRSALSSLDACVRVRIQPDNSMGVPTGRYWAYQTAELSGQTGVEVLDKMNTKSHTKSDRDAPAPAAKKTKMRPSIPFVVTDVDGDGEEEEDDDDDDDEEEEDGKKTKKKKKKKKKRKKPGAASASSLEALQRQHQQMMVKHHQWWVDYYSQYPPPPLPFGMPPPPPPPPGSLYNPYAAYYGYGMPPPLPFTAPSPSSEVPKQAKATDAATTATIAVPTAGDASAVINAQPAQAQHQTEAGAGGGPDAMEEEKQAEGKECDDETKRQEDEEEEKEKEGGPKKKKQKVIQRPVAVKAEPKPQVKLAAPLKVDAGVPLPGARHNMVPGAAVN